MPADAVDGSIIQRTMSERDFRSQVISMAEALEWKVYHHDTQLPGRIYDVKGKLIRTRDMRGMGWPDLVMVRAREAEEPRIIFAELKSEKGRMSLEQQEWLELLGKLQGWAKASVYLWRPADIDAAEQALR